MRSDQKLRALTTIWVAIAVIAVCAIFAVDEAPFILGALFIIGGAGVGATAVALTAVPTIEDTRGGISAGDTRETLSRLVAEETRKQKREDADTVDQWLETLNERDRDALRQRLETRR